MNVPQLKIIADDLCRYAYNNDSRMKNKMIELHEKGMDAPFVAKLVGYKAGLDSAQKYQAYLIDDITHFRDNPFVLIKDFLIQSFSAVKRIKSAEKEEPIKGIVDEFEKKYKKTYPRTHKLRNRLINDERVIYGKVTKAMPKSFSKIRKYAIYFL